MTGPEVLFVGHSAERTGPPIGLLHFLRWIKANTAVRPQILLLEGGPLLDAYREIGPVTLLDEWQPSRFYGAVESALDWGPLRRWTDSVRQAGLRRRLRSVGRPDLVYVNTAWTLRALRYLPADLPVVAAIHELEVGLDFHLPDWVHDVMLHRPDHVIAVSRAVAENLTTRHGLDGDRLSVHYEMIDARVVGSIVRTDRRAALGAAADTVLVAASGLAHWRKAPDLFIRLAVRVIAAHPGVDVRFVWVGGDHSGREAAAFRADVARSGLGDRFVMVPHVDDPLEWFAAMDVFVLPAREDAFPLVCLEAAAQDVPVICFDNGGMPEFVGGSDEEYGAVVMYPDMTAMAAAIGALVADPDRRVRVGAAAGEHVRSTYDIGAVAPGLWATVERCL